MKISAKYVDNSNQLKTVFKEVYIVIENDDFKIRIGRTALSKEKIKGFKLNVVGMKRNVYLTIKTPRKVFEFRDIEYKYVEELKVFEKDYATRRPRNVKKLDDVVFNSAIGASNAANKTKIVVTEVDEPKVELDHKKQNEIKLVTFIPRNS